MLYLVLLLVLGALGLLVTALITASSLWAWVSIGLSAVAGLLLVADVVRRNARRRAAEAGGREAAAEAQASAETPEAAPGKDPEKSAAPEKDATGEKDSEQAGQPGCAERAGQAREPEPDPPGVPAVEQSTPDDAALVSELEVEVVVVDELPRYHRTGCDWLGDSEVIPIPVKEARGLGFTPCARCTPDAHLAAAHRTSA